MIARKAALTLACLTAPTFAATAVLNGSVKLLAGPGENFNTLTTLNAKTKVGVLWCGPSNFDWCLVSYHKTGGWVHTADLLLVGPSDGPFTAGGRGGSTTPGGGNGGQGGSESRSAMGVDSAGGGVSAGRVGATGVHNVGGSF